MKRKIISGALLIIIASSLITGFLSISLIRQALINNGLEKLVSSGLLIHTIITEERDEINYIELAKELKDKTKNQVTFLDGYGEFLTANKSNGKDINAITDEDISSSLRGNRVTKISNEKTTSKIIITVIMPAVKVKDELIIVKLDSTLDNINTLTQIVIRNIGLALSIGIITALVIAYGSSRSIIKPINQVTSAAKHIANGNFNKRVVVETGDEIEDMARTFNHMANTIENNIKILNDRNYKLNAIMVGMVDGIIAIDCNGKIMLINDLAKNILGINLETPEGLNIFKLLNNTSIKDIIDKCINEDVHSTMEMSFNTKPGFIYKVKASCFLCADTPKNKGIVLVMEDITEIKKTELLKRDFIINASHELKTPLTTISGFIETLKLGNYKDNSQRERFLNIIESETNRLKRLTQNMLNLAVAENMKHMDNEGLVEVNIKEVFNKIKDVVEYLAENKNISLHFNIDENLNLKITNKDWFKQLFLNLIENAIKYTENSGNVFVYGNFNEDYLIITVEDDGIGISSEELPKIFDRFYRVDKSRASEIQGTGLGLAIVKHIVKGLKGKIEVESELGKGTKFITYIPLRLIDK